MIWPTTQNENKLGAKNKLQWGFKAKAERLAKQYREELNIHACGPLCAFKLAEHLKVPVFKATQFITLPNEVEKLSNNCEWSALTMPNFEGTKIILHNPFHSDARQQSDLMHELAHIICEHEHVATLHDKPLPFGMREYDTEKEEEAKCLGSTLQLAKPCLLWANKRNMTYLEIAEHFTASIEMVKYRMNTTGIAKRAYFQSKI
ncbi:MAG: ImmA/IrrE family metallo-endopeptidase [Bacteroidia bacterium]|nr:ImmA/IrrE family metallo-endopeptidase [Bacteroidia bacterium]MBP9724238.1 ImmA/IrrE family metallo-endopeptidase [Bacteroidia bacterium]